MTRKLTLVNSLKLLLLTLIVMNLSNAAYARKVTLTKTGGNGLLYTTGITLVPNYSQTTIINTIDWDEANILLGPVINWTDIFNNIASIVNADYPQNALTGVSYKIEIDAPSSTNPLIVCNQIAGLAGYFSASKNSMLFLGNPNQFINQITVTSGDPTNDYAYIKYADNVQFGSFLNPGQTIQGFVATKVVNGITTTYNTTSNNTTSDWPSPWSLTPVSFTNNDPNIISLDLVTPIHTWVNVSGEEIAAYPGKFLEAQYCNNIRVEKLDIDGNSEHAKLGGVYGDHDGIQIAYNSVYYFNCTNSKMSDCRFHSMGLDGITVAGALTNIIDIDNCVSYKNGRQGFSWVGGNAITCTESHFSHSGRAFNILKNQFFTNNPSAGMDIESHSSVMTNGKFIHCFFEDNAGQAVINDADILASAATNNMQFIECTFSKVDGYGLWVRGEQFLFDHCHIYCPVVYAYSGTINGYETQFKYCDFEDKPYNGVPWSGLYELVSIQNSLRTNFENCTFTVNDAQREFATLKTGPVNNGSADYSTIENCSFIYNNDGFTNNDPNAAYTFIEGVIFKGNNSVTNNMQTANSSFHNFQTAYALVEGSSNACQPNILEFSGRISHCLNSSPSNNIQLEIGKQSGGILDGYAKYILHNEAQSCVNPNNDINIGKFSSIQVENNASFNCGNSTVEVNGQMIQEANSYLEMKSGATFTTTSTTPLLYIDQACNPGGNTLNPIWGPCLGGNSWYGTIPFPQLCVQGNHPTLSAYACSAPLYNNISTNGAFSIMYNLTPNGGNTDISYTPNGTGYTVSFDGVITTANPIVGVADGCHKLIITYSASGCGAVAFITTGTNTVPCCDPSIGNNVNLITWTNPTALAMIAQNGNVSTFSNKILLIDGIFTIDHDITFDNCTLYFTNQSYVQMQSPYTLDISNSTLQASCDYWNGIVADDVLQKVIVKNNSTIKDATVGVYITNNALAEISDSHFENNQNSGIVFSNMTSTNYTGFVLHNTFTSNSAMIAPYTKGSFGITVNNVTQLNIGDFTDAASGNDFTNLFTGIFVSNSYSTAVIPSSHIGIYNNTFDNITNSTLTGSNIGVQKINKCYNSTDGNDFYGAAIFARNTLPNLNDALIDVKNTNYADASLAIKNCDKAIVSIATAVNAKHLYIDNCLMGVMNNVTTGRKYQIESNTLENVYLGIQLLQDYDNSSILGNIIHVEVGSIAPAGTFNTIWPIGIDVRNFTNLSASTLTIEGNFVDLDGYSGTGINLLNTGTYVNTHANELNLTNTQTGTIVCMNSSSLSGISSTNANSTIINKNNIYGNPALLNQTREDMCGILLNKSLDQELNCNYIEHTRFGITAINNCTTNDANVKGNTVHESVMGWVFRHLVDEGTFGNVGDATNDNNNTFTGAVPSAKVFKFCENTDPAVIFTNLIAAGESQSVNINTNVLNDCKYDILDNTGATYFTGCPSLIQANPGDESIRLDEALAIATDTKEYAEYPVLGHWYDSKRLFNQLSKDAIFRNSHPTLLSFYNSTYNSAIAQEHIADARLQELIDNFTSNNPAYIEAHLEDTEQANEDIDDSEAQDENEQIINRIYLKVLRYSIDSLSVDDSTFIVELANQCPYIGGSAVFKARSLITNYYPSSMFDDLKLCSDVGIYKQTTTNNSNTKSIITRENEYLQQVKQHMDTKLAYPTIFSINPNPTNSQIIISYRIKPNEEGQLIIYDILGRERMTIYLQSKNDKAVVGLNDFEQGIFIYKYFVNNIQIESGKLLKE